jgi:cholesterol transport system auxiliary component
MAGGGGSDRGGGVKVNLASSARRRPPYPIRLAALFAAAALAGCTSLIAGAPSAIYDLSAPGAPSKAQGRAQVLVPEPTAVRALDTDRIAARPTPAEYAYLPGAVWSDRLPKLLQTRLVQTLQNSGRARAVGVPGQGILVDFQLVVDVRAFELTQEGAVADFVAKVMDDRNGRVLATQSFRHVVPVTSRGTAAVVQALDQAMDQAFVDIANWALR